MASTRYTWTILLLLAVLLGSAWIVYSREPAGSPGFTSLPEAAVVGHPAPDFTLSTPDGRTVTLTEVVDRAGTDGLPIVLNFWATWCGPCRIEMPHFQRASETYDGRVAFLGVNQAEAAGAVTHFGDEYGITYPLLLDSDNRINALYGINGLPTTIFIDGRGIVRELVIGTINEAVLENRIEKLLSETGIQ
jgi:cytochrome c biogenesis protein CcmG, thiol:disulfide interchange protein DsbE